VEKPKLFPVPSLALVTPAFIVGLACLALGQSPGSAPAPFPGATAESPSVTQPAAAIPAPAVGSARPSIAHVTVGNGILPNDHGQV